MLHKKAQINYDPPDGDYFELKKFRLSTRNRPGISIKSYGMFNVLLSVSYLGEFSQNGHF